jgi:predicted RNA-binding protein YlxR (DUF448 family)
MKTKTVKGPRPKHVPQRTCVACRQVNAKRGLVRIVRTPTDTVEVDETGKRAGRGAYLCRARECWDTALKKKALEYALKTAISLEDKTVLQAYGAAQPPRVEADYLPIPVDGEPVAQGATDG